jgi:hypothetical protein
MNQRNMIGYVLCNIIVLVVMVYTMTSTITTTNAWVFPTKEMIHSAGTSAMVATMIASTPLVAHAGDDINFAGSYSDPFHTNCQRVIVVPTPTTAILYGTDGNPSCPADGSGKSWELTGTIDGSNIYVDFTPKGGPRDLKGVFDTTSSPGIKWPDGNKWSLITKK